MRLQRESENGVVSSIAEALTLLRTCYLLIVTADRTFKDWLIFDTDLMLSDDFSSYSYTLYNDYHNALSHCQCLNDGTKKKSFIRVH